VIFLNLAELKQDFYKRYSTSEHFLTYSRAGLLCSLLGDISIKRCPALTCALSMRVQVYGRRIDGDVIKLQSTKSNTCIHFHHGSRLPSRHQALFEMIDKLYNYGVRGAELIFDSSVPDFFNFGKELKIAVFNTLTKLYDVAPPIEICANGDTAPYHAIFEAKKGYCVKMPEKNRLPLPLSGYKIIAVQSEKSDKTPRTKHIQKAFNSLKQIYPHIHSFADVSPELLESAKSAVKDKTALNYTRHIADDCRRIKSASEGLTACNPRALFDEMNLSEQSIEKLWCPERQHVFLARKAIETDGVMCARIWKNGIIGIVREDSVDYALDEIIYDFENIAGYKPHICIADTFGDAE
jgi:hypothetical protein